MTHIIRLTVLMLAMVSIDHAHGDTDVLDLSAYKGQVVMLDFWASWCGPCRHSFPWLNEMQGKYKDQGLKIVGINVDAERADAHRFLQAYPSEFDIVYDSEGRLASEYKVLGMPSSVIIDRDGNIVTHHHGFRKKKRAQYEQQLRKHLIKKNPATAETTGNQ